MNIKLVKGDILQQDVEVIVNPWNQNIIPWWLIIPKGVSGAIKKQGGYAPFKELGKKGRIPLGHAIEISAGKLPFKSIIHVASINILWRTTKKSIRDSVQNAMKITTKNNYCSIALPLIGAGCGGLCSKKVLIYILEELVLIEYDGEVRIVTFIAY